jgi:hypothetical protein
LSSSFTLAITCGAWTAVMYALAQLQRALPILLRPSVVILMIGVPCTDHCAPATSFSPSMMGMLMSA